MPEGLQLVSREMPGELVLNLGSPIELGEGRRPMGTESIARVRTDKGQTVNTASSNKLDSGARLFTDHEVMQGGARA